MTSSNSTSYFSSSTTTMGETERLRLDLKSNTYVYYRVCIDGRYYFQKMLQPQFLEKEYYRETLRKEFELGSTLQDECIVRYRQLVDTDTECYVLMDYVNGLSLADFVKANPGYFSSKSNVQKFLNQILRALDEMHTHQALHLDLKPANIMLTEVNTDVRIIDLGCSYTDVRPHTTGHTDRYAAPEQMVEGGRVDARTDLYAVGRMLDEFGHGHFHKMAARCMEEEPDKRYQSAQDMLNRLNKGNTPLWALSLVLALLICGVVLYFHESDKTDKLTLTPSFVYLHNQDSLYLRIISEQKHSLSLVAPPMSADGCPTRVSLPDTLIHEGLTYRIVEIAPNAFRNCKGLKHIQLPTMLTHIRAGAFRGCSSLTSVAIPEQVMEIGDKAFAGCKGLEQMSFVSVESMCGINYEGHSPLAEARHVLVGGEVLTELVIPDGVKVIRSSAFEGARELTSVSIPASVESIGENAFSDCPDLVSVKMAKVEPVHMEEQSFHNANLVLYVPLGSREAYANSSCWRGIGAIREYLVFADAEVEAICLAHWDADGNGMLTLDEANAVKDLGNIFKDNVDIKSFDELRHFTGLTHIADSAFFSCLHLTTLTLPETVKSIGTHSFMCCIELTQFVVPGGVSKIPYAAFYKCRSMRSLSLPSGITSIDREAFGRCSELKTIALPDDLESIGDSAFFFCTNLQALVLPPKLKTIGDYAFRSCESLTSVVVPPSVVSMGNLPFSNCNRLNRVDYASVEHMCGVSYQSYPPLFYAHHLYMGGREISALVIPKGVASIADLAFEGASWLASLSIPASVASISPTAFRGCSGLKRISVDAQNRIYDSRDHCNAIIETATHTLVLGHAVGDIPQSVKVIGQCAFAGSRRTSYAIPEHIARIEKQAFFGSPQLQKVTIPSGVSFVGEEAFADCRALRQVYCHAKEVPNTDALAFRNVPVRHATLYVPASALKRYQTTSPWNGFGTIKPVAGL